MTLLLLFLVLAILLTLTLTLRILPLRLSSQIHNKRAGKYLAKFALAAKQPSIAGCSKCGGKGAVNCQICAGTGIDKKGGSILERWTCKKCKGFGFVSCSCNPVKGLTPEQTGER